jgi:hypothetical protein
MTIRKHERELELELESSRPVGVDSRTVHGQLQRKNCKKT